VNAAKLIGKAQGFLGRDTKHDGHFGADQKRPTIDCGRDMPILWGIREHMRFFPAVPLSNDAEPRTLCHEPWP
jgi:hypothetical protein